MNFRSLPVIVPPLFALGVVALPNVRSASEGPTKKTPTAIPQPTLPSQLPFDPDEDKIVNNAVTSAVRKGDCLEVESDVPYGLFYFRAVPPAGFTPHKTLSSGQAFVLHDRHGSIEYQVLDFQKEGLVVNYYSHFNMRSFGDSNPHKIRKGSFIIRFKEPKNKSKTKKKK